MQASDASRIAELEGEIAAKQEHMAETAVLHATEIAALKASHEAASASGKETAGDAQKRVRDLEETKASDTTKLAELQGTIAAQQERVQQLNTVHEKETAALRASHASAVAAALVGASD